MRKLLAAWASLGVAMALGCQEPAPAPRLIDVAPQATSLSIQRAPSNSGDLQKATVGSTLPQPLRVQVLVGTVPAPGVTVSWTVQQDTLGVPASLSAPTTITDASGLTSVGWTLGSVAGLKLADASISGSTASIDTIVSFIAFADPGPASHLRFSVLPANALAGKPISPPVQVAAVDAFENQVGFLGGVSIALGARPGAGVLSGTTSVEAPAGLATFTDLSIDLAGTGYTFVASGAGLASATSPAFNVRLPPNSVTIAPALVGVDLGTSVPFTATVANDASNAGVTWTLTGAGCSGSACGTLSTTISASGVPITYTAPAAPPLQATVTLQAKAVADSTAVASATGVITTPGQVSVYVAPAFVSMTPNGSVALTATVFNDPAQGGVSWTLSGGNCPSACGTLSAASSASGIAVTYHAPSSPGIVIVTATSVADPGRSAPARVTVGGSRRRF